jgi:hypothetical protein
MSHTIHSPIAAYSYQYKFQEAQSNLNTLIKEERLKKRIEKSRKKNYRPYD